MFSERKSNNIGEHAFEIFASRQEDNGTAYATNALSILQALRNDPVSFAASWESSENLRDYLRGYYVHLGEFIELPFADRWQWLLCALQANVPDAIDALLLDENGWHDYIDATPLAERFSYLEFAVAAQHENAIVFFLQDGSVLNFVATLPMDYQLEFVRLIWISHSLKAIAMLAPIHRMIQVLGLNDEQRHGFLVELVLSLLETDLGISDVTRATLQQLQGDEFLKIFFERLDDKYHIQKNYLREMLGLPSVDENEMTDDRFGLAQQDIFSDQEDSMLEQDVSSEPEEIVLEQMQAVSVVSEQSGVRSVAARRKANRQANTLTDLITAIKKQDEKAIADILSFNPQFLNQTLKTENRLDDQGFTPLFYAAKYATENKIVSLLLETLTQKEISNHLLSIIKNTDSSYVGWNAFMIAFQFGAMPVAVSLFERLPQAKQVDWLKRSEDGRLGRFHSLLSSCLPFTAISANDEKNSQAKIQFLLTHGAVPTRRDLENLASSTFSANTKRQLRYLFHTSQEGSITPQLFLEADNFGEEACVQVPAMRMR